MERVFIVKRKLTNQASMLGIVIGEIISNTDNCYYILHKKKLSRIKKDLVLGFWDEDCGEPLYGVIEKCYDELNEYNLYS